MRIRILAVAAVLSVAGFATAASAKDYKHITPPPPPAMDESWFEPGPSIDLHNTWSGPNGSGRLRNSSPLYIPGAAIVPLPWLSECPMMVHGKKHHPMKNKMHPAKPMAAAPASTDTPAEAPAKHKWW